MPWKKGVKRVGYIKKDGTPHGKKGSRITVIRKDPKPYEQTAVADTSQSVVKSTDRVDIHGATGRPVIEPCPNCGFAYADGGFCEECPWQKYDPQCPHCTR